MTLFSPESHVPLTGARGSRPRPLDDRRGRRRRRGGVRRGVAGASGRRARVSEDEAAPLGLYGGRRRRRRAAPPGAPRLRRVSRQYVPYLEESAVAPMDWRGTDDTRSLSFGETGIRLVLQRLAPSTANRERLAELIAANAQDEHCELMSGSAGTILAGREVGLDVTASVEWLRAQRDEDGLWTQRGLGEKPVRYPRARARVRRLRPRAR